MLASRLGVVVVQLMFLAACVVAEACRLRRARHDLACRPVHWVTNWPTMWYSAAYSSIWKLPVVKGCHSNVTGFWVLAVPLAVPVAVHDTFCGAVVQVLLLW
jgi:hypothetical protein